MKIERLTRPLVYGAIILLSLAILLAIILAPPTFSDGNAVYQGF